ncbi:MAG: T9SS type A sorting domain-containing protein [Flavobacteriales bacterium]|mgnify:CR=1 FL=1|nr:T9SS type A sorting domain-containing protein [Flavobacteriales bacterium]
MKWFAFAGFMLIGSNFSWGQIWCPPGATWTYEAGLILAGFQRMSYTHDTLVGGYTAQVIDRYSAIQYPQAPPGPTYGGPPIISYDPVSVITRSADDVVFTLSGITWDTLYWFGAVPGDHWYPAHAVDTNCEPLLVSDTGTMVVDDVSLRWLNVSGTTVIERIGSTFDLYMYCPNYIIDGPTGMRCYSDDEIAYALNVINCESLVGLNELAGSPGLLIFPNPGIEHFNLNDLEFGELIEVYDVTGKIALKQRSTGPSMRIDASGLSPGAYHIRAGTSAVRWMKK